MELLLTLICGLFFLVGIILFKFTKHKKEFSMVSMSAATIILIGLIIFDLIPELLEIGKWWLIIFTFLGLIVLILIDKLIPHHHHDHHEDDEETKDHQEHMAHIGIITIIALLLHNIIEGMALYGVACTDLKSGILMTLGIGLHNLPFGFQIAGINSNNQNKLLIVLLVLSGLIGGLIINFFGTISAFIEGIIIAITLGMLLHILLFEFLKEVYINIKQKPTIYGIIIGGILLIIINLI